MSVKRFPVEMLSFGIYSGWDPAARDLPQIETFTTVIPAAIGREFGYTLEICKAKGRELRFEIAHPPIRSDDGKLLPIFRGKETIPRNRYQFFLGDAIWAPLDDKLGEWSLRTFIDDQLVADKTFQVAPV